MRTAIIAPTKYLDRYCTTGYHLALAHLVNTYDKYKWFYWKVGQNQEWVILDNSMIELGHPMSITALEQAIDAINPAELVLPDYVDDPITTLITATQYASHFKEKYPEMSLMAVPHYYHSHNLNDWKRNHDELCSIPEIASIGVPKFLRRDRAEVCEWLDTNRSEDVEYHLLGTWGNPLEVKQLAKYKWIRGVDSKAPVRFGLYGVALHPTLGLLSNELRDHLEALDFNWIEDPMPIITQHNVDTFISWASKKEIADVLTIHP